MPGRVAGSGDEAQLFAGTCLRLDKVGQPRGNDGTDRILENRDLFIVPTVLFPVSVLLQAEQVPRVGKRWHPFSAIQPRVPTDVIYMKVGADDEVDGIGGAPY